MVDFDRLAGAVRNVPDFPTPGIQFKDISPLLGHPELLVESASRLARPFEGQGITKVVCIEARGFILGGLLAERLGAGFVPVRKPGKLPYTTRAASYALEYGTDTVEMHVDALASGDRALIHDDVIATGGTAAATARLVAATGARLIGFSFLVELAFLEGRGRLAADLPCHAVLTY